MANKPIPAPLPVHKLLYYEGMRLAADERIAGSTWRSADDQFTIERKACESSAWQQFRHRTIVCVLLLVLSVQLSGCDYFTGIRERSWSEDVKLDDGSVITIDRHVKFDQSNALGGGAYSATELESTLSFRGELASLPTWNVPLIPLVLYRNKRTSEWVIVATTASCEVWRDRGQPVPSYWEFRNRQGHWQAATLSSESIGRKTNLFFSYNADLRPNHLTWSYKESDWRDPTIHPIYKSVSNERLIERACGKVKSAVPNK